MPHFFLTREVVLSSLLWLSCPRTKEENYKDEPNKPNQTLKTKQITRVVQQEGSAGGNRREEPANDPGRHHVFGRKRRGNTR